MVNHDVGGADAEAFRAKVLAVAKQAFGIDGVSAVRLPGDLETNVKVVGARAGEPARAYILRLFTSEQGRRAIEFRHAMVGHAVERDGWLADRLQQALRTPQGESVARVSYGGRDIDASVETFIEGRLLADVAPHSPQLLRDIGTVLGRVNVALAGFDQAEVRAELPPGEPSWRLVDAPHEIASRLDAIDKGPTQRDLVARILERATTETVPSLNGLPVGMCHQDANENNIIVSEGPDGQRVAGLIDFGDAARTALVCEPAIAAAYAAMGKRDPLTAMGHVIAGYHDARPLSAPEFAVIFDLALLRLASSVAISSARAAEATARGTEANAYHLVSQRPALRALELLADIDPAFACALFREMAGLDPMPARSAFEQWSRVRSFSPVIGASLSDAPRVDLSVGSSFLVGTAGRDLSTDEWGAQIEALRAENDAAAVLGFHGEARTIYSASDGFTEAREDFDEPRSIHLGVDVFAPAGTTVYAPLSGRVVSVARNDAHLDYGPTLILEHSPVDGPVFWTLYGHLDGEVLERHRAGDEVHAGDVITKFGGEHENGGWPPHLHFQVILDRLGFEGDFPGVASPSRRAVWASFSPDPAVLLGLDECCAPRINTGELLDERRTHFCASMSISYAAPLQTVKGRGTTLFDADGRAYLDAVNNVPHVGHCHPRVVLAGQRQMGLLNTNTRYLSEGLVRYASKLRAKLPGHLDVIYFVSSGSEANEVALRLARAATGGRRDILVQEHGYHGHTGNTVSSSHYKFAGPGGFTPPEHVHVVPLADALRGKHRGAGSGPAYVEEVRSALERLASEGRAPAAMLAEAIIGCGGQVVPPDGYLRGAFDVIREFGGLAIADEVQVGFGRVGSHFWAFDEQGAVPDIVTMGKPIGNAHPLAAVATTRAIADAFAGGMEFFATFGGNNVSAAIGEAVLDVIEDEGLQANALARGAQFFEEMHDGCRTLPFVGDVRGRGLYLGVDLVKDRETLEPWGAAATYVANRMKERGILISTDGPQQNVLKIKPPITFTQAEMARLTSTLVDIFTSTALVG